MIEAIDAIQNVGFPIAISIYLIISRERVIKNNTIALTEVKEALQELKK